MQHDFEVPTSIRPPNHPKKSHLSSAHIGIRYSCMCQDLPLFQNLSDLILRSQKVTLKVVVDIYIYILSSIIKIKDIDQQLRQPLRRKRPRVLRVSSRDAHLPAPLDSSKRLPNDRHPTPFRKHPQVGAGARVLSGPRRGPQRTAPLFPRAAAVFATMVRVAWRCGVKRTPGPSGCGSSIGVWV